MSGHSIEELKRQYEAAKSRTNEARSAEASAGRRYDDARFEATGFKGCVAEFTDYGGKVVRFIPHRVGRYDWNNEIEGNLLKKDGTEGERTIRCKVEKARNLGPFEALRTSQDKGEPTNG